MLPPRESLFDKEELMLITEGQGPEESGDLAIG
jgi:hypothetical protein